jgi:protein-tyrosine phosphatase
MNTVHLRFLCSHHGLGAPTSAPTKVPGGFHHKMWRVETERGTYAVKELCPAADLSDEDTIKDYNVSEAIAETFASVGVAAVVALKAADGYLTIVGDQRYLVYPWCDHTALPREQVDARHGLEVARLLAKMHGANIHVAGTKETELEAFPVERIDELVQRAGECQPLCAKSLSSQRQRLGEIVALYNKAIIELKKELVISHGDLDQKNILWDDRDRPVIIDWEAAGKLNPTCEVIRAALDWSGAASELRPGLFRRMLEAYQDAGGELEVGVMEASLDYIAGEGLIWLLYVFGLSLEEVDPRQEEIEAEKIELLLPTVLRMTQLKPDLLDLAGGGRGSVGEPGKEALGTRALWPDVLTNDRPFEFDTSACSVERTSEDDYRIRWDGTSRGQQIAIYMTDNPANLYENSVHSLKDLCAPPIHSTDREIVIANPDREVRHYFLLQPESSKPIVLAERKVALEGTPNFRDLGGYETAAGRRLRWGRIYRSGKLCSLTEADVHYFKRLGVSVVCDFRLDFERHSEPSWLGDEDAPNRAELPVSPGSADSFTKSIDDGIIEVYDSTDLMKDMNRDFVINQTSQYARMFQLMLRGDHPILIHCASGKDRTGFGAAIILDVLGVHEETIVEDYLLTNQYLSVEKEMERLSNTFVDSRGFVVPDSVLHPMIEIRPEYIKACFEEIEHRYESKQHFYEAALGLDETMIERLKAIYLE